MKLTACLAIVFAAIVAAAQGADADSPLPPSDAARSMQVPDGFEVTLFAGEPDVMQPIGFCIDDRSRLWVAEAYNYPRKGNDRGDRIIVLEDRDGDGHHDQRTVFYDGLNYVTGIEVGFGGAWVMSPPNLYFIPDRDGDDVPDGEPEVILNGFGIHANAHNLANGFAWGPDGWLYGTHGRTNWSMIGTSGTPDRDRVRFDGGVYRYHPVRRVWEAYADGTTNPWGIDWNDYGHAFISNCVNPHLFQVIQGAHYEPWRGRKSSQNAYQRVDTIADHLHFVGLSNVQRGLGTPQEDAAGGGHAHCGTMIYLGDSFPKRYRNTLLTNNIHGRRTNNDILRRRGSGYVASHGPDFLRSQDPWFMGVTLACGSDGEVYVSDWSDTGECHSTRNTRRHTGRIFRVTYGKTVAPTVDLAVSTNAELVELQGHRNDWFVRHARRLLQERTAVGQDMSSASDLLRKMFDRESDITRKLRAMWALNAIGELDEALLTEWLDHDSEHIRSWSATFLCENGEPSDEVLKRFERLASNGDSPLVRLSLASGLQRLELRDRWNLAAALADRSEDEADQNLPLMIWYGCEPLINDDLARFAHLGATAAIPRVRVNIARRIVSSRHRDAGLELLSGHLAEVTNDNVRDDLLEGMLQGVSGQRAIPMPDSWREAYIRMSGSRAASVRERAVRLAVVFNDEAAIKTLRKLARDANGPVADRVRAINALVAEPLPDFDVDLVRLLNDASVHSAVLKGLGAYDHPDTVSAILKHYSSMSESDKQNALMTLASRELWALELLQAVEEKKVDAEDLTAYGARQMRVLGNDTINNTLSRIWGEVRETPQDRQKQITRMKQWLTPDLLSQANTGRGEQLFKKQCASCHRYFGEGGKIGPDITGAQRTNLDYLLENIIAPSASVSKDYQMEIVLTDDGRVLTGLVEPGADGSLIVQTVNDRIAVPRETIEERTKSSVSMMPQGLLDTLSDDEIRDLIAYLQRRH